jgi:hypothetical protein
VIELRDGLVAGRPGSYALVGAAKLAADLTARESGRP